MKCTFWEEEKPLIKAKVASNQAKRRVSTRSSEEEHMENALASGAEEGRDKLRKAAGSCK